MKYILLLTAMVILQKEPVFSYICNNVSNILMNLDSEEKFVQLMNLENASLKRFVKFLVDIWEHRKIYFLPNKQSIYVSNSILISELY